MIRSSWIAVSGISLILLVSGCAPARRPLLERALPMERVIERVVERNNLIETMKGDGSITIESPEASMTGSFDVRLRKPDSVRVDFSGPFGIHIGTAALSRRSFVFYNWRNNESISGLPDEETIQSALHVKLGFDEIIRAFTCEFPFPARPDTKEGVFSVDGDSYVFRFSDESRTKEYYVDGDAFVVTSYRLLDTAKRAVLIATASDIDTDGPVAMPHLLRIIFPVDRRSLTISYGDIAFNEPVNCSFRIPRGTTRQ